MYFFSLRYPELTASVDATNSPSLTLQWRRLGASLLILGRSIKGIITYCFPPLPLLQGWRSAGRQTSPFGSCCPEQAGELCLERSRRSYCDLEPTCLHWSTQSSRHRKAASELLQRGRAHYDTPLSSDHCVPSTVAVTK